MRKVGDGVSGRIWLDYFTRMVATERRKHPDDLKDAAWTGFMGKVMKRVGKEMGCHVAQLRPENKEESGEYLNIDAMFIDNAAYVSGKKYDEYEYDPFVLPRAVVELENDYDIEKISYCLWKILCVRAPIRVLICYQKGADKVTTLKQHLEDVIWQGSLMKGTNGDLLVIIGNEPGDKLPWEEYFSVFEWRDDRLVKIEGLKWEKDHSP
ncbi:MAG: hypothetical protein KAT53_09020 [Dehalococcoidia bacterium]|nr:hypothetical protein [Dehalococcoidia bacterium]